MEPLDQPPPPAGLRIGPTLTIPAAALDFAYSSASGPGGQNVNKKSTKCQLRVRLADIGVSPSQLSRLRAIAGPSLIADSEILIASDEHRSQSRNREECLERLTAMVRACLTPPKVRRPTKPTRGSKERRLQEKRIRSERKQGRGGFD
ncbi:MAG: aminoacyl-tRNA hydrolase [Planctomycetes bacterium]|nr:aminoacyl-tRNA hydrolase [Planctomycetota bacterium]